MVIGGKTTTKVSLGETMFTIILSLCTKFNDTCIGGTTRMNKLLDNFLLKFLLDVVPPMFEGGKFSRRGE